ncbi:GTPase subunit of restriction endonuclease [[Clostridium] sordellii]|uniref:ATPase dynein-related AAA domain-containing protein n=1 Tax=Paraclostridium sordellii TaxID=1505 RepID=A0ABM9RMA9_PARSO|nr:AAA family ATPase [Paeniclostridium sordellii]CEJ73174.1 hypothetical protein ATCC9714_10621 [[Clostridium] sordellii] [Paeniclostridium sordellii]CEN68727.1 GTPase subunit of restriction endonuclease [[Clostridium] sordellii] [Paeniclostridium sordellii]CEN71994.1 GTPase subunit of restriction endonuclease [[Clostridium] sordellii] [Paeniclostridium sordellii]CEP76413.1 GTPase subunit of restriction endonuclease [[Clostridium] sordellii] [Paeniclostridium sordellii]
MKKTVQFLSEIEKLIREKTDYKANYTGDRNCFGGKNILGNHIKFVFGVNPKNNKLVISLESSVNEGSRLIKEIYVNRRNELANLGYKIDLSKGVKNKEWTRLEIIIDIDDLENIINYTDVYLQVFLKYKGIVEDYIINKKETWIFQGNPIYEQKFDFNKDLIKDKNVSWSIKKKYHVDRIKLNDEVYIWRSDGNEKGTGGIVAYGVISSKPYEVNNNYLVDVKIDEVRLTEYNHMMKRIDMKDDVILSELLIIKQPNGTNYKLQDHEARYIKEIWQGHRNYKSIEDVSYWTMGLGKNAEYWDECRNDEEILIGWDYLGNLNKYKSKDEITKAIKEHDKKEVNPTNNSLAVYQFLKEIQIGDIVVAKQGKSFILGYGIVVSDYMYYEDKKTWNHSRKVKWIKTGKWNLSSNSNNSFAIKVLTNITQYKDFIEEIFKIINGEYGDVDTEQLDIEKIEYIPEDTPTIINQIYNYIQNQGYAYTQDQLSNLFLSLKTKPFVILAGISGTGKSKIVRLFSEAIGATTENKQFNMISVRPDWNDGTELMGYKNLNDDFIDGSLTKIIKEASKPENKNKPYFACLDEMNLARVEYYLSDYLSIIESRKKVGQDIITDSELQIPDNIYLIGTVNMDDTTFTFSRKVLDRANTIEFSDVNLENLFEEITEEEITPIKVDNRFLKTTYLKTMDIEEEYREYAKEINKKIIEINNILKQSQKQFAYRVRDEILFYMIENKKSELLNEDVAFDYQIMQKILPAITGSEQSIAQVLIDLFNFTCEGKVIDDIDIEEAQKHIESAKYKKSAQKIVYMLKGYQNDGYISYWY